MNRIEDVIMTVTYVIVGVMIVLAGMGAMFLVLIYCAERMVRWEVAATPALVDVELMPPVLPAAAAAVEMKLRYFPYSAEGRRASEKLVCAICLEVFENGDECSEVPACLHMFHQDCIGVWMKTKSSCPLCRRSIAAGSEGVSIVDDMV